MPRIPCRPPCRGSSTNFLTMPSVQAGAAHEGLEKIAQLLPDLLMYAVRWMDSQQSSVT